MRSFGRLGVVAATVAVVAAAGYALGRDSASDRSGAAATGPRVRAAAGVFARLAGRPLVAPELSPGGECPDPVSRDTFSAPPGVPSADSAVRRAGPVLVAQPTIPRILLFFDGGSRLTPVPAHTTGAVDESAGWRGAVVLLLARRRGAGPLLVRGGDVGSGDRLGFGRAAQPALALRVRPGDWRTPRRLRRIWGRPLALRPGWRALPVTFRIRRPGGCFFLQLDRPSFSERILFGAIWN